MTTKWTKAEALEKFVNDRVLGDAPFGYDLASKNCDYKHSAGGGCAIGCLLPAQVAFDLDNQSIKDIHSYRPGLLDQYLEDSGSDFWQNLQLAHDYLALLVNKRDESITSLVRRFETHLRIASQLA